jgi:hypothetical protein
MRGVLLATFRRAAGAAQATALHAPPLQCARATRAGAPSSRVDLPRHAHAAASLGGERSITKPDTGAGRRDGACRGDRHQHRRDVLGAWKQWMALCSTAGFDVLLRVLVSQVDPGGGLQRVLVPRSAPLPEHLPPIREAWVPRLVDDLLAAPNRATPSSEEK